MKKFINIAIFVVIVAVFIGFMSTSKDAIEIVKNFQLEKFNGRSINDIIERYKGTKKVSWKIHEEKPKSEGEFSSNNLENLKEKRDKIIRLKKQNKINKNIAEIRLSELDNLRSRTLQRYGVA